MPGHSRANSKDSFGGLKLDEIFDKIQLDEKIRKNRNNSLHQYIEEVKKVSLGKQQGSFKVKKVKKKKEDQEESPKRKFRFLKLK